MKKNKIFAVIPARGGSKAIRNKNIVEIFGAPLLHHSITACTRSKHIESVWVSTDSRVICNAALDHPDLEGVVRRPKKISDDFSKSEDALLHFADFMEERVSEFDILVFVQCTSPLTLGRHLDEAIDLMYETKADSVISVCDNSGGWFCGGFDWRKSGDVMEPSYDLGGRPMRQNKVQTYRENGAFYITKTESIKKSRCRVSGKIVGYKMPSFSSFEIDSQEDLDLLRRLDDAGVYQDYFEK